MALLGGTLLAAWLAGSMVTQRALHREGADAREQLALYADALRGYIDRYRTFPAVLALDPQLRSALTVPLDAAAQARLNERLERVNGATQSSTLTLIDRHGISVAASNWRSPSSNVGYDYSFRPYFQHAVEQGSGRFYGVGATTSVPGYFLSEAIRADDGTLLGVVVIKLELRDLERRWLPARDSVLVSDEHGVVILANRPDWHYRELRELDAEEQADIERTRQYPAPMLRPLRSRVLATLGADGQRVLINDALGSVPRDVIWQTLPMDGENWTLHLLRSTQPALIAGRTAALAAGGSWLALLFLALFVQGRVRLARLRRRSREELEQLVKQHAAELRTAQDSVVEAARHAALGQSNSLEHLPQGVSIVDAELRLLAWNRRYVEIFRYPAELMQVGRPIEDLFRYNAKRGLLGDGRDDDEAIRRRLEHLRAGTPYQHERERPDGTVLEIRGNPLPGGGFVTSYADITQYRNAARDLRTLASTLERRIEERTRDLDAARREAERANLYKTRFVAAAVHDLLQPLNAARMFVSELRGRAGADQKPLIEGVEGAMAAQDAILNGLLDISRLESGKLEVRQRDLCVDDVLAALAREFAVLAQARGLRFDYVASSAVVHSDADLLRRIVQNFLSNALRYTPAGRIVLGCRRAGNALRIEVWDTGVGIPETQRAAIFEEFRRLDTGHNSAERGAGLGLAIVERIARLLNHEITVRSWPGRGSVFAVSVPRGTIAEPVAYAARDERTPLSGLRVCCVSDDADELARWRAWLESWGCEAMSAADDEAAWAPREHPDLLLIDAGQATRDVHERLEMWRARLGERAAIVTVTDASAAAALREGGLVVLTRPLRPAALRALLTRLASAKGMVD